VKKVILILLSLTITLTAGWWRTYGEGIGRCVQKTDDGGYVITGSSWLIIKVDANGDVEWRKEYDHGGYCIEQTSDRGYIISSIIGVTWSGSFVKTDSSGEIQWVETPEFGPHWVEQTIDGGYIVTGEKYREVSQEPEDWCTTMELMKTDENGEIIWEKSFGPIETWSFSGGNCVHELDDGSFFVVGFTGGPGRSYTWVIKTDSHGEIIWEEDYLEAESGAFGIQTSDGGYLVCSDWGDSNVIKIDSVGNLLWERDYYGLRFEYRGGPSIRQTPDGNVIIISRTLATDSTNGGDLILLKTYIQR